MAVAFDAVGPSSAGASSAASPLSWSHTPVAVSAVTAGVCLDQATTSTTCTATCGGVSMTLIGKIAAGAAGNNGFLYVFGLANVASGAKTIAVTFSGSTDVIAAGSVSFSGADTASPFGAFQSVQGTVANPTKAFTTGSANGMVAGFVATGASSISAMTAGTSRFISPHASAGQCGSCGGGTAPGTGSPVTLTWTIASGTYAIGGAEILPPGAAPAVIPDVAMAPMTGG